MLEGPLSASEVIEQARSLTKLATTRSTQSSASLPIVLPAGHPGSDVIAEAGGRAVTIQVKTRAATNPALYDLKGDALRADFLVLVRLNLWRDPRQRPLRPDDPTEPIAWVLSLKDAQRAWKQGGYPHEKRNALRIPKVREILNEHIEDWDQVIRALN